MWIRAAVLSPSFSGARRRTDVRVLNASTRPSLSTNSPNGRLRLEAHDVCDTAPGVRVARRVRLPLTDISRPTPIRMETGPEYRVQACNLSHASENKIHDDTVARRFGFGGGLVPGVELYAYMTHLPVARWGIAWLERGTAECRFMKPVYDGRLVCVSATAAACTLAITLESEGQRCASGSAVLPDDASPRRSPAAIAFEAAPFPTQRST